MKRILFILLFVSTASVCSQPVPLFWKSVGNYIINSRGDSIGLVTQVNDTFWVSNAGIGWTADSMLSRAQLDSLIGRTFPDDFLTLAMIGQNGASTNEVITWNGSAWVTGAVSGIEFDNPHIQGDLTVTGNIINYNFKKNLDTSNVFSSNADTFLFLLGDTNFFVANDDSFEVIHPSAIYIPGALFGYTYWMAATPFPNNRDSAENIFIYASHNGVDWEYPAIDTGDGLDTLIEPIWEVSDMPSGFQHLSDPDLIWGPNQNEIYVLFRATDTILGTTEPRNHWFTSKTTNGLNWEDTVRIFSPVYVDTADGAGGADLDTATLSIISPSIIFDTAGLFTIFAVEDTNRADVEAICRFNIAMWHILDLDVPQSVFPAVTPDTVFYGDSGNASIVTAIDWPLPEDRQHWHFDVIPRGADEWLGISQVRGCEVLGGLDETDYPEIYAGLSYDRGLSFDTNGLGSFLIDTVRGSWDSKFLYRPTGFFVNRGHEEVFQMYYTAKDTSENWHTGLTYIYFRDISGGSVLTYFTESDDGTTSIFTATAPNTDVGFDDNLLMKGNHITGIDSLSAGVVDAKDSLIVGVDAPILDITGTGLSIVTGDLRIDAALDLGGFTSLEIPNGANPTTDAEGEIAWDTDDDAIEIYDGTRSVLIPSKKTIQFAIWEPELITPDTLIFWEADSTIIQNGIVIESISIMTSVDGAYTAQFMIFTAADPPALHDEIDTLVVGASDRRASSETFEDVDAQTVDIGQSIGILTPATDINSIKVKIRYYIKDNN